MEFSMKRTVFYFSCLLLFVGLGLAAEDDKGKASVKVVGLEIHRSNPDDQIMIFNPGTSVTVMLSQPGKAILGLDGRASKLETFADDKKTDLTKTKSTFGREWLNAAFLRFNKDSSQCVFQIYAPGTPVEGADKVFVKANLAVLCGKEEKVVEQKNAALKVGDKATLDAIEMNVQKGFPEGKAVTVVFTTPDRSIKTIEFIDSKGKAINQVFTNTNFLTFPKPQCQTVCSLSAPAEPVTIKVTYFSKTETIMAPVDLRFGVGF
jgi:hypothetical protein